VKFPQGRRLFAGAAVLAMTGGCALVGPDGFGPRQPCIGAEPQVSELASLADALPQLPLEEQREQLAAAERDWEADPGVLQSARLALVLVLADRELRDLDRARTLLADPAEGGSGHESGLAALLHSIVERVQLEQERSARDADGGQGGFRAATDADARTEIQRLERRLAVERAQRHAMEAELDELQDIKRKFDELKNIERQLEERAPPSRPPMDTDDDQTQDLASRR
jgi:hypothetical protein